MSEIKSNAAAVDTDISGIDDIKIIVDEFYGKVRRDELLKDIFNDVIKDRWDEHLQKMYRFWQTVLLGEHTYFGNPFVAHAYLPVSKIHFDRWIQLFSETVDKYFSGEKAERAKWQGERMAQVFNVKIKAFKETNQKPLA